MNNSMLSAQLEALLSAVSEPQSVDALADICDVDPSEIKQATAELKQKLEGRGLAVIEHEDTLQLVTDPEFSDVIQRQEERAVDTNLTSAQAEALSVIAYMSPVTKPTIDFIRGVNSRAVLRNLSTRGLVDKQRTGERVRFTLSTQALQHLGVTEVSDLPKYQETQEKLQEFVAANQEAEPTSSE